ncbi:chromatin protein family [Artemisia annua]|uniref:Chromatin protein family n=1 Tax=Artemisia annua TaxID=35608 RepID=A0A2U1MW57_ARTAN|nr:chromatin protein family [Artemisia annua]
MSAAIKRAEYHVPLYNTPKRFIYRPSKAQDSCDGGSFPELHHARYSVDIGRKKDSSSGIRKLCVKQNEKAKKIAYSQQKNLVRMILKDDKEDDDKHMDIEETTQPTKSVVKKIVNVRLSAEHPKSIQTQSQEDSKFIKYTPSKVAAFNLGTKERIARTVEVQVEPSYPPMFKHKRILKANGLPLVTVMQSPPRPVTVEDQQDWTIPPCISNSKNSKGYNVPLDKHLAADGRCLEEDQIHNNIEELSGSLYIQEQKSREADYMRSKVQKELMLKYKERKEEKLRALAENAGFEGILGSGPTKAMMERFKRGKIREKRRKERELERKLKAEDAALGKNSKITRDRS